ncbi:hypothetical protein PAPYR_2396 [Paratrimastix pyriformis]|uniref:B30.2/SPRY domain-containing protein n=1 Tax=Paratrimastix pyriformis TaxID=342808 RepID=A0ABQ8USM8_9EUKA|nr:hypothetical protein PAPYR_2396 [Paratrimastix pyriformis]
MYRFSPEDSDSSIAIDGFTCCQTEAALGTCGANCCASRGRHYFEVRVEKNRGGIFAGFSKIGGSFTTRGSAGLGLVNESWAIDAMGAVGTGGQWKPYHRMKLKPGMTIGALIEFEGSSPRISFFCDGSPLGIAFDGLPPGYYRPSCSLKYKGTTVVSNFGQIDPFTFPPVPEVDGWEDVPSPNALVAPGSPSTAGATVVTPTPSPTLSAALAPATAAAVVAGSSAPPPAPPAAVSKRTLKQPHAESVDPDRAARLKALEAEADERGDEGIAFAPEPAPHHRAKAAGGDARLVTKNEKLPLLSGRSGLR